MHSMVCLNEGVLTFPVWNVSDMNAPREWYHVMFTHGVDINILDDDDFLVAIFSENGIIEHLFRGEGVS